MSHDQCCYQLADSDVDSGEYSDCFVEFIPELVIDRLTTIPDVELPGEGTVKCLEHFDDDPCQSDTKCSTIENDDLLGKHCRKPVGHRQVGDDGVV